MPRARGPSTPAIGSAHARRPSYALATAASGPSLECPFAGLSISVFSPMVLRLSRGDNATARPSMAAWTVAAYRVRVQCQSPAVASHPSADADLWTEHRTLPGRVDGRS